MISEKIELLGKGLYENIPNVLTLKSIPTASELEYVGSEDFNKVMIENILPAAVEEDGIDFGNLLEIDYQWLCRCLRMINYGPYYTTNAVICGDCNRTSHGEYQVNLNTVDCKPLPEGFVNSMVIKKDEFIEFEGDVEIKLPTIRNILNAYKDKAFQIRDGKYNRELARMCYMISSIKGKKNLTPVEIKMYIQNELSAADYIILKNRIYELTDYGLRGLGIAQCPQCHSKHAAFIVLTDDRFFRPTMGNLRQWKLDRGSREDKNISRNKTADV